MPSPKICAYSACGHPFSPRTKSQQYCSISCGSKARTLTSPEDLMLYFLIHTAIPGDDILNKKACWPWTGSLNDAGYGMAFVRNTKIRAHRLAYELFVEPIPEGMDLLHGNTCQIRACVNPWHVRPGTNAENAHDRVVFGGQIKGSAHYMSNLSEVQVLHILQEFHDKGMKIAQIAKKRRMRIPTIHDIIYRITWRHVAPGLYPAPSDQRCLVTADIVKEIRRLREHEHWTYDALAEHFQLKYGTVIDICTYRTWKHVTL